MLQRAPGFSVCPRGVSLSRRRHHSDILLIGKLGESPSSVGRVVLINTTSRPRDLALGPDFPACKKKEIRTDQITIYILLPESIVFLGKSLKKLKIKVSFEEFISIKQSMARVRSMYEEVSVKFLFYFITKLTLQFL